LGLNGKKEGKSIVILLLRIDIIVIKMCENLFNRSDVRLYRKKHFFFKFSLQHLTFDHKCEFYDFFHCMNSIFFP